MVVVPDRRKLAAFSGIALVAVVGRLFAGPADGGEIEIKLLRVVAEIKSPEELAGARERLAAVRRRPGHEEVTFRLLFSLGERCLVLGALSESVRTAAKMEELWPESSKRLGMLDRVSWTSLDPGPGRLPELEREAKDVEKLVAEGKHGLVRTMRSEAHRYLARHHERSGNWEAALHFWTGWPAETWCTSCAPGMKRLRLRGIARCLVALGRHNDAMRALNDGSTPEASSEQMTDEADFFRVMVQGARLQSLEDDGTER